MLLEAKISNPIRIRMGKNSDFIMTDENDKKTYPLVPGAIFSGEHYGFVLIVDYNGRQREIVYPTQCKIEAAGIENGYLKFFEESKKNAWIFDRTGKLEHSAFDEFTDKFRTKLDIIVENCNMFMGEPTLKNPISIKIAMNPEKSVILKDENIQENFPLYPGAMIRGEHYGFILIIEHDGKRKEIIYQTQNKIDAIGIEGNIYEDLKIFECGKYHPWLFTFNGKFKNASSYNQYSKRDKAFVEDCYRLNENSSGCFTLQVKK